MNYSLHIPRPSLSGSTTSTRSGSSTYSSESNSYLPVGLHTSSSRNLLISNSQHEQQPKYEFNNKLNNSIQNVKNIDCNKNDRRNSIPSITLNYDIKNQSGNSNKIKVHQKHQAEKFNKSMDDRFHYNNNYNKRNNKLNSGYDMIGELKRGSRSSQGSTDSNNSTVTASSGSLLLTTANLERFVAIHNNKNNINHIKEAIKPAASSIMTNTTTNGTDQTLNSSRNSSSGNNDNASNIYTIANNHINKINGINNNNLNNINDDNTILEIDPNLHFIKTKDVDAISIASSTHFTMVNGVGGPQRKTKSSGICSRGHQLTVLILTMSTLFLIGILLMVYLMEMRARDMPQM